MLCTLLSVWHVELRGEMNVILILRGKPGIGKTTVCQRIFEKHNVDGFITKEVRRGSRRIGFDIFLIKTKERIPLARETDTKRMVGKYEVFVENLDKVIFLLENMEKTEDTIIIDELGKMESLSKRFVSWVMEIPKRWKNVILTAPSKDIPILREFLNRWKEAKILWMNVENRDRMVDILMRMLRGDES